MKPRALLQPFLWLHVPVAIGIRRQITVAHDDGRRKLIMKPLQQRPHGFTLRPGSGVARLAEGVEATLVADADRVFVVALAVSTLLPQWPALMHLAVARNVVVVSDILPPPLEVVFFAPTERVVLCRPRPAAMQHD